MLFQGFYQFKICHYFFCTSVYFITFSLSYWKVTFNN